MGVCWCGRPVSTPQHVETTETQPCTHWPVLRGLQLVIQLYGMYLWQSDIEVLQCPAPDSGRVFALNQQNKGTGLYFIILFFIF